jgi:putative flippase GtrA
MISRQKERIRFIRFALVGLLGAIIDFGLFNLLVTFLFLPALWSSVMSFIAAVISNFYWNRQWTYPDSRSKPVRDQLFQFSLVSLFGLVIRVILFWLLETPLIRISESTLPAKVIDPTFAGHNLTLAIAILVVMLWNFFANRLWTYNDVT